MNYRHSFHAGNFADVFKHAILIALLESLKAKQTPFCYFETHAGSGRYDLRSEEARKTREYESGVMRLLGATRLPAALHIYLNLVRALNPAGGAKDLAAYPGSPLIAASLMREQDRAILCEMQSDEAKTLKSLFAGDARISVHHRDGYAALAALVPPKEKRGVVLIDPPFEAQEDEFRIDRKRAGNGACALAQRDLRDLVSDQVASAGIAVQAMVRSEKNSKRAECAIAAASGQLRAALERMRHGHRQSAVEIRSAAEGIAEPCCASISCKDASDSTTWNG